MRKCDCSGRCGTKADGLTRREFLGLTAAGTASAFFANSLFGQTFSLPAPEYDEWKQTLVQSKVRVYRSGSHSDARLHLGGIGTGNFEIGVDGQFTRWQLFNTLRDGHVALHFAIKAGNIARLLQTIGGPEFPRVKQIEMTGEYPFAQLRFTDPELPLEVALEAFSPFSPLDAEFSSIPLAAFVFRIRNSSAQTQEVSLAGFMQNPIGYDAEGVNDWRAQMHPAFGANVNEVFEVNRVEGLYFRALPAPESKLDKPLLILAGTNLRGLKAPPVNDPVELDVRIIEQPPKESELSTRELANTVIWLEDAPADLSESFLRGALDLVQSGATLVFSGRSMPLLNAYAAASGGKPLNRANLRPDIAFEDFENGYVKWSVEGDAFGSEPAHGTLPNQQNVTGFLGRGLVNTYLNGDTTTGRLTSKPFLIERHHIRFLIGGGRHPQTQIRLLVEGKPVRSMSGKDNERLEPASWDVREFEGQTAQLVIVDGEKGGWGHINVDEISFSDQEANYPVLAILDERLPGRFKSVREVPARGEAKSTVEFVELALQPDARRIATREGLDLFVRPLGKGQVVLAQGPILEPGNAQWSMPRQRAFRILSEIAGVRFSTSPGQAAKAPGFGTIALAPLEGERTVLVSFEDWEKAWQQFAQDGHLSKYSEAKPNQATGEGRTTSGAVASTLTVAPGATVEVPFLLSWHYPNKYNGAGIWMGCHYATQWSDARAVLIDVAGRFDQVRAKTELFRRTLYDSTLPYWALDCLTANAAILRHIGVVFRIGNGDVYGWEGSNGCCEPTCTHVWGYEQTFARLFPALERDMRRIDFKHQQRSDGGINNRTHVPSPPRPTGEQPFADGHASCILKAYREALNSTDESFFREYWPHIKLAVEYLIDRDGKAHGGEPAGYLEDEQWNTYDEALHGVTTFISGYYLAALRAGEEWARRLGFVGLADRWHALFEKGQNQLVQLCWNGEYFQQHLPGYENRPGEVGPGCMADQLIGQWWAHQLGLGYILPKEKVITALRSIFRYNFKTDLTGWKHLPRAFAGTKDKGLIICTWPKGGRPNQVMLYSDEVWTGIEYQVASHLIYEGLIEEGLSVAKAARDRYDGLPRAPIARNPWDEIECGGHYARAMSSWSLLLALSGWQYDGPRGVLRLDPRQNARGFKSFWSGPAGWGTVASASEAAGQIITLEVHAGEFQLTRFDMALERGRPDPTKAEVRASNRSVPVESHFHEGRVEIGFENRIVLKSGERVEFRLQS